MDHNNQPQKEETVQQNPTLDAPGSKVADYGNSTGGSAVNDSQQGETQKHGGKEAPRTQNSETLGNP